MSDNFRKKKIIIVTHVYATGPAQDLEKYLTNNGVKKLLFIGHPLFYQEHQNGSGYKVYKEGRLVKERYSKNRKFPLIFSYLKDLFFNIYWIFCTKERWDLFVGSDNLNAFCGVWLKRCGLVKKVVYYVIDYVPQRFESDILNGVYHWVDKFCVKNCDETWNLSPRMAEAREKYKGLKRKIYNMQKVVPIGIWYNRVPRKDFSEIEKHTLVFMGHILEKQGVQYVLDAMPEIVKQIPDFKFLIIGGGNYSSILREKIKNLNIEKYVRFTGFIENHKEIEEMLSGAAVAVALYEREEPKTNFTYFADPAKLKCYLAAGLPILLTDVPHNAREIQRRECGLIIEPDLRSITNAVIFLMEDEEKLKRFRENSVSYAKQFDWNLIFKKNLEKVLL